MTAHHRLPVTRRHPLAGTAGAVALPGAASARTTTFPRAAAGALPDPFTVGVASGDPFPDGMVLWTRLAPDPLAADGSGGMPARPVEVEWEPADDERFRRIERRGRVTATPDTAHTVHVEPAGLTFVIPDRAPGLNPA